VQGAITRYVQNLQFWEIVVKVSATLTKCSDATVRQNFAEFLLQIQFTNVSKHTKFQVQNLL